MQNNIKENPKAIKSIKFTLIIIIILTFGCKRDKILQGDTPLYKTVQTQSKILKAYSIDYYQIHSSQNDQIKIGFINQGKKALISYTTHAESNTRNFSYTEEGINFFIKFSESEKTLYLKSSRNDIIDLVFSEKGFVHRSTKTMLDPTWYTKLNFDYILMIKMFEIIKETIVKEEFVSSIDLLNKRVNDERIIKAIKFYNLDNKVAFVSNPCSSNYATCTGETKFDISQTLACDASNQTLGGACSNQYCIGACQVLGCDCMCAFFDYLCSCTAKGRYCTGGPDVN